MASESITKLRPEPAPALLTGAILMTAGYLLPWFPRSETAEWTYGGWSFAGLDGGGGWTNYTFAFLLAALLGALWAGRSHTAAMWAVTGVLGAAFFALCILAASFSALSVGSRTGITEVPFGIGIPLLAVGFGVATAGGIVALARTRPDH